MRDTNAMSSAMQQQHGVRAARLQIECLEAAELDRADHQECRHEHQREHGNRADRLLKS